MKKFVFSLEKVLKYKEQVENNLKNEHAQIISAINDEKQKLYALEEEVSINIKNVEYEKQTGCTVQTIQMYEVYQKSLEAKIRRVKQVISQLEVREQKKIDEILEAKKETSSLDIIKDKRFAHYNSEVLKAEEHFIEEFVNNTMIAKSYS